MVHYIRFLKTARVVTRTPRSVNVRSLITITTDLGDSFLLTDVTLSSSLVQADKSGTVLCRAEKQWRAGCRELSISLTMETNENGPPLRLHISHAMVSGEVTSIPSILDAWSAPFSQLGNSPAEAMIERQVSLPDLATTWIWETTGDSIAKHIW
jgi:hypothetical protein